MGKLSNKAYYLKFILYLSVIVLMNIAGLTLFFRTDLTDSKMYSLSPASQAAVATLSEPLTIKVFFSQNLPAPHNNTERYLRDLLTEYAAQAGRYFNFTFYDLSQEAGGEQLREMARDYGISPVQIRVIENDELKFKNAYMGLVMLHGDLIEKIPAITTTDGLEYQLTTAIQKLNNKVSALVRFKDKVKVTLYLSSGLNTIAPLINLPELPGLAKAVERAVADLNRKNLNILEFSHVDVNDKEEIEKLSAQYDLMALNWPGVPEKNITPGQGTAGLVISYKDQSKALPLISAMELPIIGTTYQMANVQILGEAITAVMEKIIGINKDMGYLADHGAPALGPDRMAMMQGRPGNGLDVFNRLVSTRYNIKPVELAKAPVPEGLNCLIIAKPTKKFTEWELFQIDQALMKGTNVAVFADAFEEGQATPGMGMPSFTPIDTGLEKLLAHYGVKIDPAYILDKNAYKHQTDQSQGGGEQTIYFAPLLKEDSINNDPLFMKNIKGLVAMQASPVSLIQEAVDKTKVTATRILASSDEAWLMTDNINLNPMFISPPTDKGDLAVRDMAWVLEGEFTSYFKGKAIPVKTDPGKEYKEEDIEKADTLPTLKGLTTASQIKETSAPVKLFVLGCAQMLHDNMLDEEGRSTNATFLLNLIDHLNKEDDVALMRSKQQTLNPLAQTPALTKTVIKTFNVAVLPVLVALFGLGVMVRRNLRKKQIAQMYTLK